MYIYIYPHLPPCHYTFTHFYCTLSLSLSDHPSPNSTLVSAMTSFHPKSHAAEGINISAVILDLDGTLLNTEQATKGVLKEFLAKYDKVVDSKKEDKRLGMTHKESSKAIIKDYDLPLTPDNFTREIMPIYREKWARAKALPGANRLIRHLNKHEVPFALASNSLRANIDEKISYQKDWKEFFSVILGSDQVKSGKPSPDIFLEAAKRMGVDATCCLVIEDSMIGVQAAKAAGMKVVAVPSLQSEADQYSIADSVLHSLLEFQPELWGLPPLEDWVDNALPIEPIHLQGLYSNGLLCKFADHDLSALPDQVSGVYFGWAKAGMHQIIKVVISIGWDHGCCTSERKIQLCLLHGSNEDLCNQQKMQLMIVGYIRGLTGKGNTSSAMKILEEDKSIASDSLDLPLFTHYDLAALDENK